MMDYLTFGRVCGDRAGTSPRVDHATLFNQQGWPCYVYLAWSYDVWPRVYIARRAVRAVISLGLDAARAGRPLYRIKKWTLRLTIFGVTPCCARRDHNPDISNFLAFLILKTEDIYPSMLNWIATSKFNCEIHFSWKPVYDRENNVFIEAE